MKLKALVPADPAMMGEPKDGTYADAMRCWAEIGRRIRATPRLLDMMSALATGWLPWGVEWSGKLARDGNRFILCCGHVLSFREAQAFVSAGLLREREDDLSETANTRDLVITEAGRTWLQMNWRCKPAPARVAA